MTQTETWKSINIKVEDRAEDYYDLALQAIREISIRLYGGHYEPCSERDMELAKALNDLYLSNF